MRLPTLHILLCFSIFDFASFASGDTVWNKQGTAIEGEVISDEPDQPLVFRCLHKGEWRTFEFARDQIRRFTREPGDQSDGNWEAEPTVAGNVNPPGGTDGNDQPGPKASIQSKRGMHRCKDLRPIIEHVVPAPAAGKPEVVILHLDGPFERANIFDVGRAISFGVTSVLLDFANDRDPVAIVLKIDSGGGRVDQMDLIIEKLLEIQGPPHNRRVVAWVKMGGSAAALTSLACKELVMAPQGRLGAAIRTYQDGEAVAEPETAGEQKLEAMRDARRRQVATLTGRPGLIQEAMEKAEHQFWHHPVLGFSLEEQDDDEWEAYDTDENKPLALDAQALVDLGIAKGIAEDAKSLIAMLGLPSETRVTEVDLASPAFQEKLEPARVFAKAGNDTVEGFKKRVKKEIDDTQLAIRAAAGILGAKEGYTVYDLRAFRSAVAKCQAPVVDKKTRDYLTAAEPDMLALYDERLALARRVFQRAKQSTDNAARSGSIAIGAILEDLRFALNNLVDVVVDGELAD